MLFRQILIGRRYDGKQQATSKNRGIRIFQRLATYIIDHEVNISDLGSEIAAAVINDFVSTKDSTSAAFVADVIAMTCKPADFGKLNGERANAARTAVNEHALAGRKPRSIK